MSTITKPQVPAGLRDLMKDLTREILKEKPTDIYDFAENYFQSRLPEKENYAVRGFETNSGKYDFSYIQNPQRYQVPVALVYSIIPEGLTNLIKELIKAVLREQPQNLCDFAVEYFRHIKAVTSTEYQAEPKVINYSAYENYFMNKERFLFTPYVKCTCGRTLGEAYAHSNQIEHFSSIHKIQNNDSAFQSESLNADDTNSNNVSKMSENYSIYSEKYMNAIYIIQKYIRRYLKRKTITTKAKGISSNHHSLDKDSMTTKTEAGQQYEHTAQEIPIVPQLQLNQNETENNSEDVSYTSASTALLSATESGREISEPSTSESILTKTIIKGVEMENDDKNISDSLKQSANGHALDEATTDNQEVEDNRNVNVPEGNVKSQRIDKGTTELMNYTTVSKNEEFESNNEKDENPLARNDLEGKSAPETQKFIKSNEHGSIDSVIVSSTNAETFGNDHVEKLNDKELILKTKSGDIHDAKIDNLNKDLNKEKMFSESELNSETEVITKESSFNLANEGNKVSIHSTNNIRKIESLDKKLSDVECTTNNKAIETCQEIEQTNSTCGSGDNISEIVDQFPIENINEITENEQKTNLDKQNDTIEGQDKSSKIENNNYDDEDKTSEEEQKQSIDIQKDSIENEAEHYKQNDSIAEILQNKMDSNNKNSKNKSNNDLNQYSLDSNMESSADIANISNKLENQEINDKTELLEKVSQMNEHENKKHEVANSTQNKSVIETNKANNDTVKTTGNDKQVINLQDASQAELHEENVTSANVSELEKDFEKPQTQATEVDTNGTTGAVLASNPKDNAEIPSLETKENFDKNETNTKTEMDKIIKEPKLETNLNNTDNSEDNHVDSIKQNIADVIAKDELNENSEVIFQNPLDKQNNAATNIGIKSEEIILEKSQIEATDTTETDKNVVKSSEVVSDKNKSYTSNFLEKQMDITHDKDSGNELKTKSEINEHLQETSNEKENNAKTKHDLIVNVTETENQENNLEKNDKNKLIEGTNTNNTKDTNVDIKLENQVDKSEDMSNVINEVIINKTDKDEMDLNQEETFQGDLNMTDNNTKNSIDEDVSLKSQSDKLQLGSMETTTTINEIDNKQKEVSKIKLCEINNTSNDVLHRNLDMNKEKVSNEKTENNNQDTIPKDLDKIKDNGPPHELKHDEVDFKTFKSIKESNNLNDTIEVIHKTIQGIKLQESPTTISLDEKNINTVVLDDLKDENQSINSQSGFEIVKPIPIEMNDKHEAIDKNTLIDNHEASITENSVEPTTNDKAAKNIQQSFQADLHEKNNNSENVELKTEATDRHTDSSQNDLEEKITSINQNVDLNSEKLSQKQQSESITSESAVEHTNEETFQPKVVSIENYKDPKMENIAISPHADCNETNDIANALPDDNNNVENNNDTLEVSNQTESQENTYKNVDIKSEIELQSTNEFKQNTNLTNILQSGQTEIKKDVTSESQEKIVGIKSEPQFVSNDELQQNTNLPKTLQTESTEPSYIIDDLSIKCEKDDIKTDEKQELDKLLNKTEDKILINDESEVLKEMSATIFEDKKDIKHYDAVTEKQISIKPKVEPEISQIDVDNLDQQTERGDQNMNIPENSITINKSNSLQEPLQMMLYESNNITGESVDKTIKQENVNDPDSTTGQDQILSKISKTELGTNDTNPVNVNDNIADATNKGVLETRPQGTSINELNNSNITNDDTIESQENTYKNVDIKSEEQVQSNDDFKQNTNPTKTLQSEQTEIKKDVTSESQEKIVGIKSEPQFESNDGLKQITNQLKTLQTEPIETSYIVDDLSIKCEKDDIKTDEKHELDKPLNKTEDKVVINDASELLNEMSSNVFEDKKDIKHYDAVIEKDISIKPKVEPEISQTDVENLVQKTVRGDISIKPKVESEIFEIDVDNLVKKTEIGDQNMNKPENSITINKSNSLQEPFQMMLNESNNITGESVDKTNNQETVNDPDNTTDQDKILSKISKTELDTNDNIAEATNTGDLETRPQGSSINELNNSNITNDDAIDKTLTESQENTYKNVDIKSEVQLQSNDELKQNTNQPKQTEPIEYEKDDIKTDEKQVDKPLNKTEDKVVINDASELFKEMPSTILEDKKDIKPKVESEISQTDVENLVQKTDKSDQNMNIPENSITINKSNSLQEPLPMYESNNITGESVDKTIKQETVNDPDSTTGQDQILSKIYKTESDTNDTNPVNVNDNIAEATNKGDLETRPQGSSINELNNSNIMTDDTIDKKFTLKSAESTDKEQVDKNKIETLAENENNLGTDDSIIDTNLLNISGSGNVAQENGKNSSADDLIAKHDLNGNITKSYVHETQMERHKQISDTKSDLDEVKESTSNRSAIEPNESDVTLNSNDYIKAEILDEIPNYTEVNTQYMDSNNIISKTPIKQPEQISEKSNNSGMNTEKSPEEFSILEGRVKRETAIETSPDSMTEKLLSLSFNDNAQPELEQSTNVIHDKNKFENTKEKDIKEKHNEKSMSLTIENQSERSFEKESGTSKEEKSSSNVDSKENTPNKLVIDSQTDQNTANNISSGDIKNINTVENMSNREDKYQDYNNDDGEKKMFADDFKEDVATSTGSEVNSQLSSSKQDTTCTDNAQKQSEIFEIKFKSNEETAPEKQLDGKDKESTVSNSYSIHEKYEQIDTTNSEDEAAGSVTNNQAHNSDTKQESKLNMSCATETVEKPQSPKQLHLETQQTEPDSKHNNDNKNVNNDETYLKKDNEVVQTISKLEESFENLDEKTSISLNSNVVPIETKQMEEHGKPSEVKNSNYNQIELNTNSEISTQNEQDLHSSLDPQNSNNQHDKDNNTNEKSDKDSTATSKNSDEFQNVQHSNNDNKNDKHLENNEISLESEEAETRYYDGSNSEDKNDSDDEKKSVIELVDNQKNFTIQNEQISKLNENVNSNESEMIQQPNSIENSSNLNESKTLTNVLNKDCSIASDVDANPTDYQLKSSPVNSNDNENKISSIMLPSEPELSDIKPNVGSKALDVNMNKLQPSIIDVQQQNSEHPNENVTIKLEDGETNANENTESFPLQNEVKTEVSLNNINVTSPNPLNLIQRNISSIKSNDQESSDSSTTKHIEDIESSTTEINKLNVSNVGNIHDDISHSSTTNEETVTTNKNELHSSAEIVNDDSNLNRSNSEKIIKINNESKNNNITNKENHISIDDQTPVGADESKSLNTIKDHSSMTSNELKGSVRDSEFQDISNQSQQVEAEVEAHINNNNSNREGGICNENSLKETHSDDHNNKISDGNGITRSIGSPNETKLVTKDKTTNTSSELNLSNYAANVETTIDNEARPANFDQEMTGQTNTAVKGENTNEQDTTHNIGIQTPETFIGNQNFNIGRIRNFNEGLLGSISGQRFAETHLKSFWKEYVMNNSIPLSQYDYKESDSNKQTMTGSVHELSKARLADNKNEEQISDIVEPEILKDNITQMESSPSNNHNNPAKDIERIPRYFYGIPDTVSNDKACHSKQKSYKEPTAFTIPMGESNKVHTTKIATTIEESSTKPNTEVVFTKDDKKLRLSKLNLAECADAEPLLDAETPTKLFQDLHEFEYDMHDVDLGITYTIDEIIRLRIENDYQHNSDNDERLNAISEYSLTPEPMLQTIIELSESETPKPPDILHSIDDDFLANLEKISDTTSTSWTTGSKEDNSFISDEFLDEKHIGEYSKATLTISNSGHETHGGIYEFAKDELISKEIQSQNEQLQDYENIIAQAPTPPNDDPFYEDLKETAAKRIQIAYRQYIQKRILKAVESIDSSEHSVETGGKSNIENDANLTSHDKINNTMCNELKDQTSIENVILKKEANVDASINPVIAQEKPTEIENYSETGENKTKQLVENPDDCDIETESNSKENRNSSFSNESDRNEFVNKTKSSSNNVNSESKQEPIVQEHLNVIILQKDLNNTIATENGEDISCSENKTPDLLKNVDETDSSSKMSNSNSEKQKFETINIEKDELKGEIVLSSLDSINLSNITDANIKVNNENSNDSKSIETNVSENIRSHPIQNANQNLSNSGNKENYTENQNNNKSNELLKSSNSSKMESVNNRITNAETSFDINNDMKEESGENNETKHDLSIGHFYFEPTAPTKEDIQSVVSQENIKTNQIIQDQAARKIQRAFKHFIEQKSKLSSDSETKTESSKTNWFVGDEPIIANDSLTKTTSEISFEETEAYVELNNPSQYLVDSSSNLETIVANNSSRSPTAPVSNRSRNSADLANNPSTNISKDTVSVTGTAAGIIENTNTKQETNTLMNEITANDLAEHEEPSVAIHLEKQLAYKNEKAFKYINLIDQFINFERHYSDVVNHHNKEIKFTSPDIAEITKILADFTDSQKRQCDSEIPYERLEEPCIKKSASRPHITSDGIKDVEILTDAAVNTDTSSSSDIDDTEDSLSTKTVKLHKPEMAITKMQQRRDSTTKVSNLDKPKDYNFDEPLVAPMDNLDTDEEGIVVNKLNREETRESSAQSDVDVIIGGDKDDNIYFLDNIDIDETFPSKGSLKRVHTIAGDGDAKSLLKNVTIDESIKYIEPPDYELNSGSLCLDDDTAENIRRKMMAYSLSEADSDCFDKAANNSDGTNSESKTQKYDDFNVSTALVENGDSSTETESTIVSAVTKIQAGARGYLTRKRLGKTSIASDGKSIPHDDINKVSFGNAAINESLEHLVQEAAAKRIQNVYRQYYRKKVAEANRKEDENFSPEFATSMENTLAQKRSIMLQRGDALRNDSTPDEGNSSSNGSGSENGKLNANIEKEEKPLPSSDEGSTEKQHLKESSAVKHLDMVSTAKTAATIRAKKIEENKMRWLAMRQNSMPVQIDSEVLRVIPKYMRKKIKSAEGEKKKKDRRRMLMD